MTKENKNSPPTSASEDTKSKILGKKEGAKKSLKENVLSLGMALVIVLMIRSSIVEAYKIPSESMLPTLLVGDHIFVNKFSYGIKLPFTEWFGDPTYLTHGNQPSRGDVIVFIKPEKDPNKPRVNYIKRVVGLPGDRLTIKNKMIFINDEPVSREILAQKNAEEIFSELELDEYKYDPTRIKFFSETIKKGDGSKETQTPKVMIDDSIFLTDSYSLADSCHECTGGVIPPDRFFVMGDNRDHSHDSRFWGLVPMENIKGKAMIIWLSLWMDFKNADYTFRREELGSC